MRRLKRLTHGCHGDENKFIYGFYTKASFSTTGRPTEREKGDNVEIHGQFNPQTLSARVQIQTGVM
jgi:hypothetical protein